MKGKNDPERPQLGRIANNGSVFLCRRWSSSTGRKGMSFLIALAKRSAAIGFAAILCVALYFVARTPQTNGANAAAAQVSAGDPLPSWNDGASKRSILDFVQRTTSAGSADFVPVEERIAVFDNDGTLWSEQPMYVQLAFVFARMKELAPQHPEWKTTQPFQGVLEANVKAIEASGEKGLMELLAATHAGMTTDEFQVIVSKWLAEARHPKYKRPYTECVYQPMLELLAFLRSQGFKTFIVSGGGVEFMRPWAEKAYGIPPEQVIGSTIAVKYELRDGKPVLVRLPQVDSIDDGPGKPIHINGIIGRRPVAAFGNSDGDQQMLEWTAAGPGARLMLLVHHDDAARETAYDRQSPIGKLDKALDEATAKHWVVVSMKDDWKTIFPATSGATAGLP
jgi:phosphoglycolate phosphatase-like HAD superfamily hydrolase